MSDDEFGEWDERDAVLRVEDRLSGALRGTGIGDVDGHEFGGGFATLYIYGPSAEAMAAIVLSSLAGMSLRAGSVLIKRYGSPGAPEASVLLVEGAA